LPPEQPLTLASYECDTVTRAHVEPVAVGEVLRDMPLYLEAGNSVAVPLEATYRAAWQAVPRRWKGVLDQTPL